MIGRQINIYFIFSCSFRIGQPAEVVLQQVSEFSFVTLVTLCYVLLAFLLGNIALREMSIILLLCVCTGFQNQSHHLMELLDVVFELFRGVAHAHETILSAIHRVIVSMN